MPAINPRSEARGRLRWLPVLLISISFAGCLAADGDGGTGPDDAADLPGAIDHDAIAAAIGTPTVQDHDHRDAHDPAHWGGFNVDFVAWSTLDMPLGTQGFGNFVFYEDEDEDLAFVAIDGDARGGFLIVDISDIHDMKVLGSYFIDATSTQEIRVTQDGRFAVMNAQSTVLPNGPEDCGICLHLLDVSDRTAPALLHSLPIEILGSHNYHIEHYDSGPEAGDYVFYVGQPLGNAPPGNHMGALRIQELPTGGALLVRLGQFNHPALLDSGSSYAHDIMVQEHPLTGTKVGYLSHWDGGAITLDMEVPALPRQLDIVNDPTPSDAHAIHWMIQEPAVRTDGRVIAWSSPEIQSLATGTGVIRAYDMTDPADFTQIGTWELPGDITIPGNYIFTPHTVDPDFERGIMALGHNHAGVWVLDISEPERPRHLGYYLPNGAPGAPYDGDIWVKGPFGEGFQPNPFQIRWKDGLLWVTERGTGLYVLDYTGPVPGPLGPVT